jgi:hypothetical protein
MSTRPCAPRSRYLRESLPVVTWRSYLLLLPVIYYRRCISRDQVSDTFSPPSDSDAQLKLDSDWSSSSKYVSFSGRVPLYQSECRGRSPLMVSKFKPLMYIWSRFSKGNFIQPGYSSPSLGQSLSYNSDIWCLISRHIVQLGILGTNVVENVLVDDEEHEALGQYKLLPEILRCRP